MAEENSITYTGENTAEMMKFTGIFMADTKLENGIKYFKIFDEWIKPGDEIVKINDKLLINRVKNKLERGNE